MKTIIIVLSILAIILSEKGFTAETDNDSWPSGSAMAEGMIYKDKVGKLEKILDENMEVLIRLVKDNSGEKTMASDLEKMHKNWKNYVKSECLMIVDISSAGGSWPSYYSLRSEARIYEKRINRIKVAIKCIAKSIPGKTKWDKMNKECLYAIMPFNIK